MSYDDDNGTGQGSVALVAAEADVRAAQVKGASAPGRRHNTGDSRADDVVIG